MDAILGLDMEDQAHAKSVHMHHHHEENHDDDDHHHHHDHGHDEFASHVIALGQVEDAEAFQNMTRWHRFRHSSRQGAGHVAGTLPLSFRPGRCVDGYFARDRMAGRDGLW